jgi:FixJ family two-component response regulator
LSKEGTIRPLRRGRSESPSCLVLDVRPPGLSGLELQRRLARAEPHIAIIFISAHGDIPMAVRAMEGGLPWSFFPSRFTMTSCWMSSVRRSSATKAAIVDRTQLSQIREHHAQLTARQRQVLSLVLKGRLKKQIAAELALSENTIKVHRRHIMEILGPAASTAGAGGAVPIIYCTAEKDADGRLRRRLLQAGAVAVLYKSFEPEQLLRLVEDALRAG